MKRIIKVVLAVMFTMTAGYGIYANQNSSNMLSWLPVEVEALAGCEVSSDGSENKGYCSSNYGGSGDSCTSTGDSGSVRCSGNY